MEPWRSSNPLHQVPRFNEHRSYFFALKLCLLCLNLSSLFSPNCLRRALPFSGSTPFHFYFLSVFIDRQKSLITMSSTTRDDTFKKTFWHFQYFSEMFLSNTTKPLTPYISMPCQNRLRCILWVSFSKKV